LEPIVSVVPESYVDLLERPLFGHLGTTRPDGDPQVNVMWFGWDGELLRFTHIPKRQKYRNIQANPHVSLSVADPDDGYRYVEVRGVVERIEDDPGGRFYMELSARYGEPMTEPPPDADDRIVIVVRPTKAVTH
jgi:PPOX class probable F420-dependent enzyme